MHCAEGCRCRQELAGAGACAAGSGPASRQASQPASFSVLFSALRCSPELRVVLPDGLQLGPGGDLPLLGAAQPVPRAGQLQLDLHSRRVGREWGGAEEGRCTYGSRKQGAGQCGPCVRESNYSKQKEPAVCMQTCGLHSLRDRRAAAGSGLRQRQPCPSLAPQTEKPPTKPQSPIPRDLPATTVPQAT